jgi:hypothetical protein
MKQITPFSISAPGFYGLNFQDSPIDMDQRFALQANNCVIDKSGRVVSRKGWVKAHSANSDLGTSNITCIGELVGNDGTTTVLATGGAFLFKLSGATLVTLTYGGGGVAPVITSANWTFCQINGIAIFWQRGFDPLIYDPAVSTTTFRRLSEKSGATGSFPQCHVALSAFGRVWAADNGTDKQTIVFSDLLAPHIMSGGTSGSLNLNTIWPHGGDEIVALAAHNNFLIIFGRQQTLIYAGADDPATMKLSDNVVGIGCAARDSVQNTGQDVIFLSDFGVMSLMRTIQEKSAPLNSIGRNVLDEIQDHVKMETVGNIKSGYSAFNGFYILTMPSLNESYCFDLKQLLPNGAARVTTWTNINPKAFVETNARKFYVGQAGYIGEYSGYQDDNVSYRMSYYTTWIDFGNPIQKSILKKILLTVIGGTNQNVTFKWAYDFETDYKTQTTAISGTITPAEYGISEYSIGEYSGNLLVHTLSVNGTSSGRVIQFGFEAQIETKSLSIQKIDLFTKDGRL